MAETCGVGVVQPRSNHFGMAALFASGCHRGYFAFVFTNAVVHATMGGGRVVWH